MSKPVSLILHARRAPHRSAVAVGIGMSLAAALLFCPVAVCAGPTTTAADRTVEYVHDEIAENVEYDVGGNVTIPMHHCIQDSIELQSSIFGIHDLSENEGLFDGCDERRPYCVKSDGVYRRGYSVVSLKSASSGDELLLQSGKPRTQVMLDQNYSLNPNGRGFNPSAIGQLRIVFRTENLYDSSKYCTGSGGTVPNMAGGNIACDATSIFTANRLNFLTNKVLTKAATLLSTRLSVDRVNGNLMIPSTGVCGSQNKVLASDITNGVANADTVVYVSAAPTVPGTIAWAGSCAVDGKGRPTVAKINISPAFLDDSSDANTNYVIRVFVHELMHTLGFSGGFMQSSYFANGGVRSTTRRGAPVSLYLGPSALQGARNYFACGSLDGVELEDEGAVGTSGSHWERRTHYEDVMSPIAGKTMAFSATTLGVFQDSGLYYVDFTQAEDSTYMKNAGCGVFSSSCGTDAGGMGKYFCNANTGMECTNTYMAIGQCNIKTYDSDIPAYFRYFNNPRMGGSEALMNYCPIVGEFSNRQCSDPNTATSNLQQASYYGAGGRCFKTSATLLESGWNFGTSNPGPARCIKSRCLLGKQVQFQVGKSDQWVSCPADGSTADIDVSKYGYTGTVSCPPAASFCTSDLCYQCDQVEDTTTPTTTTTTTRPTTTTTTTRPTTTTTTTRPTTTTTRPTTTTTTRPTTTTTTTRPTTTTTTTRPTTTTQQPTTTAAPQQMPESCTSYYLAGASPSPKLSTEQINILLDAHNKERRNVKPYAKRMPMLQWSQDLANYAQEFLDTCPGLKVSPSSRRMDRTRFPQWWYVGELMAAGGEVKADNLQAVMDAWLEGGKGYQYPDCKEGYCGAYRQLIWADTTHVGCAWVYCANQQYGYYWVCNYGVGGDVAGQLPYESTPYVSESTECTADRYAAPSQEDAQDACDVSYFVRGQSPSASLTTNQVNILLKGHNDLRRAVKPYANLMPMLQWSQELANYAQSYIDTCPGLQSSPVSRRMGAKEFPQWWYVGENMVAGEELSPDFIKDAIRAWSAGGEGWSYPQNCAEGYYCTAFTQMIWADTTHIGCAYKNCPNQPYKYYWVCNYGVGGSVLGANPYVTQSDLTQSASCTADRTGAKLRSFGMMQQTPATASTSTKTRKMRISSARADETDRETVRAAYEAMMLKKREEAEAMDAADEQEEREGVKSMRYRERSESLSSNGIRDNSAKGKRGRMLKHMVEDSAKARVVAEDAYDKVLEMIAEEGGDELLLNSIPQARKQKGAASAVQCGLAAAIAFAAAITLFI